MFDAVRSASRRCRVCRPLTWASHGANGQKWLLRGQPRRGQPGILPSHQKINQRKDTDVRTTKAGEAPSCSGMQQTSETRHRAAASVDQETFGEWPSASPCTEGDSRRHVWRRGGEVDRKEKSGYWLLVAQYYSWPNARVFAATSVVCVDTVYSLLVAASLFRIRAARRLMLSVVIKPRHIRTG